MDSPRFLGPSGRGRFGLGLLPSGGSVVLSFERTGGWDERREFITLLGAAVAGWPLVARGQQSERIRHIGVLTPLAAEDPEHKARLAAFVQGLQQLGWEVGRNVQIDTRAGAGDADRARGYAAELVALTPDVILATGGSVVGPLLKVTRRVPVVFTQTPIRSALVSSIVWRDPAATPLASSCLNTAPVENGWSCLKRPRQA